MRLYFPTLELGTIPFPHTIENVTRFYSDSGIFQLSATQKLCRLHIRDGAPVINTTLFDFHLPCVIDHSQFEIDAVWWQVPTTHVVCEMQIVTCVISDELKLIVETERHLHVQQTRHFYIEINDDCKLSELVKEVLKLLGSLELL